MATFWFQLLWPKFDVIPLTLVELGHIYILQLTAELGPKRA